MGWDESLLAVSWPQSASRRHPPSALVSAGGGGDSGRWSRSCLEALLDFGEGRSAGECDAVAFVFVVALLLAGASVAGALFTAFGGALGRVSVTASGVGSALSGVLSEEVGESMLRTPDVGGTSPLAEWWLDAWRRARVDVAGSNSETGRP